MKLGPPGLPREIAKGIWWIGGCLVGHFDVAVHFHCSAFLVVGTEKVLLFDTSVPTVWNQVSGDLDRVLEGRQVDFILVSHAEVPHAGNLSRLLLKYPSAKVLGDLRDFHLYYPEHQDRMESVRPGSSFALGGGYEFQVLNAPIQDLPTTVWGYEKGQGVLFVSDGLGYGHFEETAHSLGEPLHRPTECGTLASELGGPPNVDLATLSTRSSLYWSRYVDSTPYLDAFAQVLIDHPARVVAPAHGSVIDDLDLVMPVMRDAHRRALGR